MRLKLSTAIALGMVLWLASISPSMRGTDLASADGPIGGVDPLNGSFFQTFTFGFKGFQPNTVLTFSFLPPNATAFTIVDTPSPIVTDSSGQALIRIQMPALFGYPASTSPDTAEPVVLQFANQVKVIWGPPPSAANGRYRFDACDKVNCVDLVGAFVPVTMP